jgi:hypothetical protein
MRIFHVLLTQGFAGTERSTAESCNFQASAGHEVTLVTRRDHRGGVQGGSIVDHLDPRVRVVLVASRWFTGAQIRSAIRRHDPDIIHCHLRWPTRIVARARPRAKTVSTLHIGVNSAYFSWMDGIVANADWQLRELPGQFAGKVLRAHNSLMPHRRLTSGEVNARRAELGASPDTLVIGGVGRMTQVKGWDTRHRRGPGAPRVEEHHRGPDGGRGGPCSPSSASWQ